MIDTGNLEQLLEPFGLHLRGILELSPDEISTYQFDDAQGITSIALVGNIGSSFWPVFSQSPEYDDGKTDPLDRWSKRVADSVAREIHAIPVYPFEGPPYYPFQQWAKRAEPLNQSPLGLMIHPQYGLWHAYRFGLLLPDGSKQFSGDPADSPCLTCKDQPCLHTCPVDAFSADGYDVYKCAGYLNQTPGADCHQQGCQARNACPVGADYRYETAQHLFHLRAFLDAKPG